MSLLCGFEYYGDKPLVTFDDPQPKIMGRVAGESFQANSITSVIYRLTHVTISEGVGSRQLVDIADSLDDYLEAGLNQYEDNPLLEHGFTNDEIADIARVFRGYGKAGYQLYCYG
jgi:hypothetical protein